MATSTQASITAVRKVMSNYKDTMLTTEQVANKAGVGYNTAKRALTAIGARYAPTWPKRWTIKEDVPGTMLPPQVEQVSVTGLARVGSTSKLGSVDVMVSTEPGIVANWNDARQTVAQSIMSFDIQPTSDLSELLEGFNRMATVAASIALALSEASTVPDWYGKLFNEDVDPELAP